MSILLIHLAKVVPLFLVLTPHPNKLAPWLTIIALVYNSEERVADSATIHHLYSRYTTVLLPLYKYRAINKEYAKPKNTYQYSSIWSTFTKEPTLKSRKKYNSSENFSTVIDIFLCDFLSLRFFFSFLFFADYFLWFRSWPHSKSCS